MIGAKFCRHYRFTWFQTPLAHNLNVTANFISFDFEANKPRPSSNNTGPSFHFLPKNSRISEMISSIYNSFRIFCRCLHRMSFGENPVTLEREKN